MQLHKEHCTTVMSYFSALKHTTFSGIVFNDLVTERKKEFWNQLVWA